MLGDLLRDKHADFEACRIVLGMEISAVEVKMVRYSTTMVAC